MTSGTPGTLAAEPALRDWLAGRLGTRGPFRVQAISGGNSNETALLTAPLASGGDGRWILRCPPAAAISATANNLGREHQVLSALAGRGVPAPRPVAYAPAGAVTPRSWLVMEFSEGHPLTDTWPDGWPADVTVGDAGRAAVEALAALHRVDYLAAGLDGFGRPAGYLERQVARWRGQYEQHRVRDLPLFGSLGAWLEANRPPEAAPAILHGDMHLDNCLILPGPPATVSAIIDWELATIGDPLVDLGLLLAFWGADRAEPVAMAKVQALTRAPGAPSRRALADHYTALTGRSTANLAFYMVLAFYKLAAIVEGAYARYRSGDVDSPYARALARDVPALLRDAARMAGAGCLPQADPGPGGGQARPRGGGGEDRAALGVRVVVVRAGEDEEGGQTGAAEAHGGGQRVRDGDLGDPAARLVVADDQARARQGDPDRAVGGHRQPVGQDAVGVAGAAAGDPVLRRADELGAGRGDVGRAAVEREPPQQVPPRVHLVKQRVVRVGGQAVGDQHVRGERRDGAVEVDQVQPAGPVGPLGH
jgi:aminoglycoside phosphotransferase (APT) family kinase protein